MQSVRRVAANSARLVEEAKRAGVRYASNRGVVYMGPNKVEVQSIEYPKLELAEQKRKCNHGVILKVSRAPACLASDCLLSYRRMKWLRRHLCDECGSMSRVDCAHAKILRKICLNHAAKSRVQ